jgi:OOP family OmpA-OmpF porin
VRNPFRIYLLAMGLILVGCAAQKYMAPFTPMDLNPKIKSGQYIQNAKNLMIILDRSGSMNDRYLGQRKFSMALDILHRINRTIPDVKLTVALRTFGFDLISFEQTALVYGPISYDSYGFEKVLKEVKNPIGRSNLELAIDKAVEDLSSIKVLGKIALVIVSDAEDMSDAPLLAAARLKAMYGGRICIYTIHIGNDSAGRMLLEKIAQVGGCGFSIQGEQVLSSGDVADFLERVLLKKKHLKAVKSATTNAPAPIHN